MDSVQTMGPRLLTAAQVQTRYGSVTAVTIRRWTIDRGFPLPVKIGNRSFWRVTDLEAFDASLKHGVAARPGRAA